MTVCYQCGKPAKETGEYQGITIGTCEDGHRTGQVPTPYEAYVKTFIGLDMGLEEKKAS